MDSPNAQIESKNRVWAGSVVDRFTSTSRQWARQTLSAGKRALENSAKTLIKTASSLDELARKLEPKQESGSTESGNREPQNSQDSSG